MKMKKIAALVMVLVFALSALTGCSSKNDTALVGKWQMELDLTRWVQSMLEDSAEYEEYAEYITLPNLGMTMTFAFQEDGAASVTVELGALKELKEALDEKAPEALETLLKEAGYEALTPILEIVFNQIKDNDDGGKMTLQGKYKTDGGKLSLSFSGILALLGSAEFDYTVTGDTLELSTVALGNADLEDLVEQFLPLKLTKA